MASTHDPPFPFLALPAELRNQIYADILTETYSLRETSSKSPTLAILRVSKAVYGEAKKILYERGSFFIHDHYVTVQFLNEPSKRPLLILMQNIHLRGFEDETRVLFSKLRYVTSVLRLFSDTSIPRSSIILDLRFFCTPQTFHKVLLLDAISKLTDFKTVVLNFCYETPLKADHWKAVVPLHKALDESLGATLGPGEEKSADDFVCLTYHPQKHASSKESA